MKLKAVRLVVLLALLGVSYIQAVVVGPQQRPNNNRNGYRYNGPAHKYLPSEEPLSDGSNRDSHRPQEEKQQHHSHQEWQQSHGPEQHQERQQPQTQRHRQEESDSWQSVLSNQQYQSLGQQQPQQNSDRQAHSEGSNYQQHQSLGHNQQHHHELGHQQQHEQQQHLHAQHHHGSGRQPNEHYSEPAHPQQQHHHELGHQHHQEQREESWNSVQRPHHQGYGLQQQHHHELGHQQQQEQREESWNSVQRPHHQGYGLQQPPEHKLGHQQQQEQRVESWNLVQHPQHHQGYGLQQQPEHKLGHQQHQRVESWSSVQHPQHHQGYGLQQQQPEQHQQQQEQPNRYEQRRPLPGNLWQPIRELDLDRLPSAEAHANSQKTIPSPGQDVKLVPSYTLSSDLDNDQFIGLDALDTRLLTQSLPNVYRKQLFSSPSGLSSLGQRQHDHQLSGSPASSGSHGSYHGSALDGASSDFLQMQSQSYQLPSTQSTQRDWPQNEEHRQHESQQEIIGKRQYSASAHAVSPPYLHSPQPLQSSKNGLTHPSREFQPPYY
ncbi:putative mediator of RNA polymerase II transcription subunit 26 [Drosophila ficusphila]|uniref:putative mediator of RNA polymerase II transcription subunit 26 n=1 Tax=Drosophila ficusphila TaxID=30025 RepID=UPI0007E5D128|nr:putative mediator of RNA polymerase II transcription subunit 26 [Drosophila ficusphila]